jgi:antitoxin VapB
MREHNTQPWSYLHSLPERTVPARHASGRGADQRSGLEGALMRCPPRGRNTVLFFLNMALNIKDDQADRLARELAAETGETITTAVAVALRERLERLRGAVPRERRREALAELTDRSSARRVRDQRSAEEIVGYGPDGLAS